MSPRKTAFLVLCCVPLFLFMTGEGASEGGSSSSDFLGKIVNFVVLFGGLGYALFKPLRSFLAQKSGEIRSALDEAREARLAAEAKLKEAELKIASLESEIAALKRSAEEDGRREKERIASAAEAEAGRIRTFAEQEIGLQLKAGIQELTEYTAELAAASAEARLRARMTDDLQSDLIDASIRRLAERHEKSRSH